jgi:hypothetical protein
MLEWGAIRRGFDAFGVKVDQISGWAERDLNKLFLFMCEFELRCLLI